jgi:hypothetical protein
MLKVNCEAMFGVLSSRSWPGAVCLAVFLFWAVCRMYNVLVESEALLEEYQ